MTSVEVASKFQTLLFTILKECLSYRGLEERIDETNKIEAEKHLSDIKYQFIFTFKIIKDEIRDNMYKATFSDGCILLMNRLLKCYTIDDMWQHIVDITNLSKKQPHELLAY